LIIEQELKEILLKAILRLDERQRSIIALKFGANMKNREIAQMLNLTESNVGTILYRSLKHLRDNLKKQGVIFE
ncbi:MAG: sigma-70 family RNA polymerase sigma factor, partial [Syntrophomonadaceae bacterium]|nr:sigma-70 family RNA polymerase sigma factor [Syntrophomonadaceae bacterium]